MKTLAIDIGDDEWAVVEQHAAHRSVSVSDLVREYLHELAREENGAETRARRELLVLSEKSQAAVGPVTWTRADLHAR